MRDKAKGAVRFAAAVMLSLTSPALAASGSVTFSGHVPARGEAALFPGSASHVSFADASGIDLSSVNTGSSKVVRIYSVHGADGGRIEASVWPREAVIAPGESARLRVIVPFGDRKAHAYMVCAESRTLGGKALGTTCGRYTARRVSLD